MERAGQHVRSTDASDFRTGDNKKTRGGLPPTPKKSFAHWKRGIHTEVPNSIQEKHFISIKCRMKRCVSCCYDAKKKSDFGLIPPCTVLR